MSRSTAPRFTHARSPLSRRRALITLAALGATMAALSSPTPALAAGYLGAQLAQAPDGVRVSAVMPGGPAANAGLREGDVITRIDGTVPASVQTFVNRIRNLSSGSIVTLEVRRAGGTSTVRVRLIEPPQMGVQIGAPAPTLTAQVVMGPGPADLAALRGRVVVLDFWATWCGPCRMVMPALDYLHRRYGAQGLTVLGVTDEDAATARHGGARMGVSYTLATEPSAGARFGVRSLPTLMVLDRQGIVRHVSVGADVSELHAIEALVTRLLSSSP